MSIANELNTLINNLSNAKDAIIDKGGKVVGTGIETLAEEIATIPTSQISYGKLQYYSSYDVEWSGEGMECTINYVDSEKLDSFIETYGGGDWVSFQYQEQYDPETGEPTGANAWCYFSETTGEEIWILPENMYETTGIDVTLDDPENPWADLQLTKVITVDKTSEILIANVSETEYSNLNTETYNVGALSIPRDAVYGFIFTSEPTTTPGSFLNGCSNLVNLDMTEATNLASVGYSFLGNCTSFNQAIIIPNSVTSIEGNFLSNCSSFNQQVTIPNTLTSVGHGFLQQCSSFNQPITLPSSMTQIPDSFLYMCNNFNQSITIPNTVTSIGGNFMCNCSSFNQPLTIPSGVNSVGNSFMQYCTSFNSTLTIQPSQTALSIGNQFFMGNQLFNQPLTIPQANIGNYFLNGCTAFNSTLTITNMSGNIGSGFMSGCTSFNQDLAIPSNVASIGGDFMINCNSMVSTVDFGSMPATRMASSNTTFATYTRGSAYYQTGVTITGDDVASIKAKFPNRTSSPYRKIVVDWEVPANTLVKTDGTQIALTVSDLDDGGLCYNDTPIMVGGQSVNKQDIYGVDISGFNVTSIGNYFLWDCENLKKVSLPSTLTTVGQDFLSRCPKFNQPFNMSNLVSIGENFLAGDVSFNQPIDCSGFSVLRLGSLSMCYELNQDIVFPAGFTLEAMCLQDLRNMTSTITVEIPSSSVAKTGQAYVDDLFLGTYDENAPCYVEGIKLTGTYAQEWHEAFPDRDESPYRKLIVV